MSRSLASKQPVKIFDLERLLSEGQVGDAIDALDRLIPGLGGLARQTAGPGIAAGLGRRPCWTVKQQHRCQSASLMARCFSDHFKSASVPPLF